MRIAPEWIGGGLMLLAVGLAVGLGRGLSDGAIFPALMLLCGVPVVFCAGVFMLGRASVRWRVQRARVRVRGSQRGETSQRGRPKPTEPYADFM